MRVAVIGARRARTGTGAYLARFLVEEGAEVVALLGTSEASAHEAAQQLASATGHRAAALWQEDALGDVDLDALVIATPDTTHDHWIHRGLEARLHILCEKPLVWGRGDPAEGARIIVARAGEQQRVLRVATQWPFTLPTYETLFPGVSATATSFFMRLSPTAGGRDMFRVSLSHPLSLLAAVAPDIDARVVDPEVTFADGGREGRLQFVYRSAERELDCTVHLVQQADQPREAAYGFDDHIAHRLVDLDDYSMALEGGGHRVPMPDPMRLLVRSFLQDAAMDQPRPVDPSVETGMRHLVELMAAIPDTLPPTSPDEDSPTP